MMRGTWLVSTLCFVGNLAPPPPPPAISSLRNQKKRNLKLMSVAHLSDVGQTYVPNETRVNGNKDYHLQCPGGLILTHLFFSGGLSGFQ